MKEILECIDKTIDKINECDILTKTEMLKLMLTLSQMKDDLKEIRMRGFSKGFGG